MTDDERRLRDILSAAQELAGFVDGVDVEEFTADRMRLRAVERMLTIMGEAAKQLSDETRRAVKQPWRDIIRFRDRGIHAYDRLAPATLHDIAVRGAPELAAAVANHLRAGKQA